ncbi:hypothetical protein ELS07_05590 [Salmonella enterica subsp. enterica serovar Lomalinda]|nr:hypothetical protein [Salmonella enterica subsp. enterica serovar Lomalinda]ECI5321595.1 hypothetical protein [Salmonella enterica subsp. enterica serovar Lomalinda]
MDEAKVMSIVFWVSVVIAVLSVLIGIVGAFNPNVLKNEKTGEVPSRSEIVKIFCGSFVIFTVAALISHPQKDNSDKNVIVSISGGKDDVKATTVNPLVSKYSQENVDLLPKTQQQVALTLTEAKALASSLDTSMEKMESLTIAGLKTKDLPGIKMHVLEPLKKAHAFFDEKITGGVMPEPIDLFLPCSNAATYLQNYISDVLMLQPGVYKAQQLENHLNQYYKTKAECSSLVGESDKKTRERWDFQLKDHAKKIQSLGGGDCLTIYTPNGVAPKPAHCKK